MMKNEVQFPKELSGPETRSHYFNRNETFFGHLLLKKCVKMVESKLRVWYLN